MNVATMAGIRLPCCLLLLLAFATCNSISAEPSLHPHLLVLLDDLAIKSTHSVFFNSLSDRGYELEFKAASDPSLALKKHGVYLYDGLIVFSPRVQSFGGSVSIANILEFVDSGRDLIVASDPGMSDTIWELANECGVVFDEDPNAVVIDHLNSVTTKTAKGDTIIAADAFVKSAILLGENNIQNPVLFHGPAHTVSHKNNLVIKVLSASPSAYSASPKAQLSAVPESTGSSIGLVSVVQARNNARVLISGSLALFSNRFFTSPVTMRSSSIRHEKSGNEQFTNELTKWVFHERGHLKAVNVHHHKIGELEQPQMYRITDQLEYSLEIYEWSRKGWKPFSADDVQVQFYMMSPYILKTMTHNGHGLYSAKFQVPDVYGVFQFKVEYERLGYTSLSLSDQIPVRPFRHNEYERFIQAAYPYYSSCFSMIFGFFIFSLVFLYHK